MKLDILVEFFAYWLLFPDFNFFYLRVHCTVLCMVHHVFLLLDSDCSPSAVLFVLLLYDVLVGMFHRSCDVQGRGSGYIFTAAVMGVYLGVCFIYYYNGYVFIIWSNMELCVSTKVSFNCNLSLLKLYMWNLSSVFNNWSFYSVCSISSVWSIVLYVCPTSCICRVYFEFSFFSFVFMA
jgi:hypothetical protein